MLLFSIFAALSRNLIAPVSSSDGDAELTGTIADWGKDTDGDGKFDYLEVAVQINVFSYHFYRIEVSYLINPLNYSYYYWLYNESYLDVGLQWLNLSFYGTRIYADKFNVSGIGEIRLYEDFGYLVDSLSNVPLHTVYIFTDFDCRAVLTGTIYDEGIDTDGDGLFNSLQVGVEVNVTDAAEYEVGVSNLYGTVSVYVYNYYLSFLEPGIQIINVSLAGAAIYGSHGNVDYIGSISLAIFEKHDYYIYYYTLQDIGSRPLNRTYSYNEFDPMAFFTGKILDEGIDEDHDDLFDYLKISVEINVTDAGSYEIAFQNLVDSHLNYLYDWQSFQGEFEEGLYLVNLTVYGPKIYGAHLNPVYMEDLWLRYWCPWQWMTLEHRNMVPLPSLYNYSEFESHAFLTGYISDRGVDTDADGLFDYLEVGVEVNVTEAGTYRISVGGLANEYGSTWYYYQYTTINLDLGIHIINFTFPGPMIAYYHVNPTNVTGVSLIEYSTYCQLNYISTTALPRTYTYTQFNSPLTDMEVEFTVYPNATVGVSGFVNQTHYYAPYSYPPLLNATLGFSTSGDVTTGSVNGTMILPEYPYYFQQFPFNSTTVNFASKYNNGMLNAQLNATMYLPPEGSTVYPFNSSNLSFLGTYSDGMFNVDLSGDTTLPSFVLSQLPFNLSDTTVLADYKDNEINGNITFHTLPSFTLGDVRVNFNGNKTDLYLTGNVNLTYGNFFGIEINSTTLEEMLAQLNDTIPGPTGLVYNASWGLLECTQLNTTKTEWSHAEISGANIEYNVTIHGNFTGFFARLLAQMINPYYPEQIYPTVYAALDSALTTANASLILNYYHTSKTASINLHLTDDVKAFWNNMLYSMPQTFPPEYRTQVEALLKIANITAYAVETANLNVGYSSIAQELNVRASLTANISQLKNDVIPILPDTVPPEYREFVKSCTNTTCCTLDSLNITCNYVNGITDFDAKWLLKGDFTAELNRMKHCYVEFLNLTSPWLINWQILTINETEIDISNFKAELRLGEDWMTLKFEGLKIHPPKDEIDPVRFKLSKLFDLTSSPYEPPIEFQKLKITIMGGANDTHAVLLYAPPTAPSPDNASLDYRIMTWQNTKISSLKDLVFQIAHQEVIHYLEKNYYVYIFTNSTESEFTHDFSDLNAPSIGFKVSGATGMGFCNITIPRALIDVKTGNWTVKIDGMPLPSENFTETKNEEYVFIHLNYSHSVHTIEIVGTWVVTEFPPNMLPLILVILSFIGAIIVVQKRRRLNILKTKCQDTINTLARLLH
jgi:hypothetical protein